MRFNSRKSLIVIFLGLNSLILIAQHEPCIIDYITINNDTINSLIKDLPQKKMTYHISCYDSVNNKWTKFYPSQIKKFYISEGERLYESMPVVMENKDTNMFFRCLVDGYLSLYSIQIKSKPVFYIKNSVDSLFKLEYSENIENQYINVRKKYVGQLTIEMKDYPEIFKEINKTEYIKEDLMQLFENYNRLSKNNYKVHYQSRVKTLKNIQVGGLVTSNLKTFTSVMLIIN